MEKSNTSSAKDSVKEPAPEKETHPVPKTIEETFKATGH